MATAAKPRTDVTFARETLSASLIAEMRPLLDSHWREVAFYPDIQLEPDLEAYADRMDSLVVFTVRDEESRTRPLLGYAIFCVARAAHYKSSIQASQDVIYLDPSVRGGNGARFIRWCDEQLAGDGVQVVQHHVKVAHDWSALLERMGYEKTDYILSKRLDRTKLREIL